MSSLDGFTHWTPCFFLFRVDETWLLVSLPRSEVTTTPIQVPKTYAMNVLNKFLPPIAALIVLVASASFMPKLTNALDQHFPTS
jgi:hypothetical protein